jgi:serine/threonine protein kinase
MCAGVQAIHDAGIVHRDLKPENILLTPEDTIKITDFGIARTDTGPRLTEHGGVLGTIDYVSPEYMIDSKVDWRSDLYAIGVMAYEMITGDLPFRGESVYATMTKRLKSDPPPPSSHISACPPALDAVVLRAMRRDPTSRYQSAAEIFYDLEPLSTGNALPSGAFMQISRRASSSYQGPILEGTRKKSDVRVLELDESKDPADTAILEEIHGSPTSASSKVEAEALSSGFVDRFLASSWADGLIIVAVILLALGISFVLFEKVSP